MADTGGEWVLVGAKRRSHKANSARQHHAKVAVTESEPVDRHARVSDAKQHAIETRIERIAAALLAQASRDKTALVGAALRATADHLGWSDDALERRPLHIVSYGLGSFCASSNAVHQLAFVHALVQAAQQQYGKIETVLEVFDPVMNVSDRDIAATFGIETIGENEGGKREASAPTVFFMPHCGHALYQNVVAANVSAGTLANSLIIGNSFEAYSDRLIDAAARKTSLMLAVLPFVTELPLQLGITPASDDFPLYESAFNDLSIHTFSPDQARAVSASASISALIAAPSAPSSVLSTAIDLELIA